MKNNLHILLLCENDSDLLEQKQTGLFAIDLVKKGFDVSILVNNHSEVSQLESIYEKIKIYYTKPMKWYQEYTTNFYEYNLKQVLKKDNSIDIVQVMSTNYKNSYIAKACNKLDIPCLARVFHKSIREYRELNAYHQNKLRKNLQQFTKLVVNAEYLISLGKQYDLHNLTLIYDGIYTNSLKGCFNKTPTRKKLNLPERTTLITCPASISRVNNQFETIKKLMPLGPTKQLVFLGDIEDRIYFENLKRELEFLKVKDYVHFIGQPDSYTNYLKASDLLVLLGGIEDRIETIVQAEALGVPVILGESPSSLFLTNANRCGVVLYDENILVEQALDRLVNDSVYRQSRAVNAREFALELFPREKMIADYSKLYSSL